MEGLHCLQFSLLLTLSFTHSISTVIHEHPPSFSEPPVSPFWPDAQPLHLSPVSTLHNLVPITPLFLIVFPSQPN